MFKYILFIIAFGVYLYSAIYCYKNKKRLEREYIKKQSQKLQREIDNSVEQRQTEKLELDALIQGKRNQLSALQDMISTSQHQYTTLQKDLKDFEVTGREQVEASLTEHRKRREENLEFELTHEMTMRREQAESDYLEFLAKINKQKEQAETELTTIESQVNEFRAKQETINQEILRRRELEEQKDFYRICLSDEAIADVDLIRTIRQNLKKPEIIDKIIYDSYIAKPVLEMIKRVLQNTTCSGIYKITCLETKEIYIGKSTDIKNRWQQHCKTAFNCGTIASSVLHRKMQQYGIENFTFELLEKVSKDQLSEREAFYIDFYQSKKVGLNERRG